MKNVLVIDDSPVIHKILQLVLGNSGIKVTCINNGHKAFEVLEKEMADLVILDLMMPEMSGHDLYKMLRADPRTKDIPIIILTAKADALKWNEELKHCDSFMTKPSDNDQLLAEVKRLTNM